MRTENHHSPGTYGNTITHDFQTWRFLVCIVMLVVCRFNCFALLMYTIISVSTSSATNTDAMLWIFKRSEWRTTQRASDWSDSPLSISSVVFSFPKLFALSFCDRKFAHFTSINRFPISCGQTPFFINNALDAAYCFVLHCFSIR